MSHAVYRCRLNADLAEAHLNKSSRWVQANCAEDTLASAEKHQVDALKTKEVEKGVVVSG